MEELKIHENILCIDLKSFYASAECVLRGLDPFTTPLVVADPTRGGGTIVLAVTPFLKAQGIPSRLRVHELPDNIPNLIMAPPRMNAYVEFSNQVVEIFLEYVSEEDLFVYSVDEAFLDLTHYLEYYDMTPLEITKSILGEIENRLSLTATAGIGENMAMAKMALDIDAKKAEDFIAEWNYETIPDTLWPVEPLSKMWGIGPRLEKSLNDLGFYKIGDIANANQNILRKNFGVIGEELYLQANGISYASIRDKISLISFLTHDDTRKAKSYGMGQTLFRDYYRNDIEVIIREMIDEVTMRMRRADMIGETVHLSARYSKGAGGGFGRQIKLDYPTNDPDIIFKYSIKLLDKFYTGNPIRNIRVSISNVERDDHYLQLSLFEDGELIIKKRELYTTVDELKDRYGKGIVLRGSSGLEHSTARQRSGLVGGHGG